jgi:hypothetical protein
MKKEKVIYVDVDELLSHFRQRRTRQTAKRAGAPLAQSI